VGRERTEAERIAAREFADAVRTEAERFFDVMLEELRRNYSVPGTPAALTEEAADRLALAAVRRTRRDSVRRTDERRPPNGDEIEEWVRERERDRDTRPSLWKPPKPH